MRVKHMYLCPVIFALNLMAFKLSPVSE